VARKRLNLLVGGLRRASIPDPLHDRFIRHAANGTSLDRRHRVHVRSAPELGCALVELVSPSHSPSGPMRDSPAGIRPAWVEISKRDDLGHRASELFLAA